MILLGIFIVLFCLLFQHLVKKCCKPVKVNRANHSTKWIEADVLKTVQPNKTSAYLLERFEQISKLISPNSSLRKKSGSKTDTEHKTDEYDQHQQKSFIIHPDGRKVRVTTVKTQTPEIVLTHSDDQLHLDSTRKKRNSKSSSETSQSFQTCIPNPKLRKASLPATAVVATTTTPGFTSQNQKSMIYIPAPNPHSSFSSPTNVSPQNSMDLLSKSSYQNVSQEDSEKTKFYDFYQTLPIKNLTPGGFTPFTAGTYESSEDDVVCLDHHRHFKRPEKSCTKTSTRSKYDNLPIF